MSFPRPIIVLILVSLCGAQSCGVQTEYGAAKGSSAGLIATPTSYYSTARARYLGEKYRDNLNRLVETIIRNPQTASLQFANNIGSVGGIGFFTHSAVRAADERYLEVVVSTAETFDGRGEYNRKLIRLFSLYGAELLRILSSDLDIYSDKELSGYGLNLAWRTLAPESLKPAVTMERAIVYFSKEKVRAYLSQAFSSDRLLADAVIFAVEEDGPMNLVSFKPVERPADFRPPIREELLARSPAKAPSAVGPQSSATEKKGLSDIAIPKTIATFAEPRLDVDAGTQSAAARLASNAGSTDTEPKPPMLAETTPIESDSPNGQREENDLNPKAEVPMQVSKLQDFTPDKTTPTVTMPEGNQSAEIERRDRSAAHLLIDPAPAQQERVPVEKGDVVSSSSGVEKSQSLPARNGVKLENVPIRSEVTPQNEVSQHVQIDTENKQLVVRVESPAPPKPTADIGKTSELSATVPTAIVSRAADRVAPPVSTPETQLKQTPPVLANERLALIPNKPADTQTQTKSIASPAARMLEGYVIQVSFNEVGEARRWADTLRRRGFAVSMTEAGSAGSLRVRIGNFVMRDEAERQLRTLKQDGLTGIIVNLPQAYRPEVRSSVP